MGRGDLVASIILIISPMWFLAVYMALVALAPLAWRGHVAAPRATLAGMIGLAALLDIARFGFGWGGPLMTVACFTAVWAVVHQLGFHFDALRAAAVRPPARAWRSAGWPRWPSPSPSARTPRPWSASPASGSRTWRRRRSR